MRSVVRRTLTPPVVTRKCNKTLSFQQCHSNHPSRVSLSKESSVSLSEQFACSSYTGVYPQQSKIFDGLTPALHQIEQIRHVSFISPDDISIEADDRHQNYRRDMESEDNNYNQDTSIVDIVTVDTFSRARILNFVKRYQSNLPGGVGAKNTGDSSFFEISEIRSREGTDSDGAMDDTVYHARIRIPLPAEYGDVYGEGIASSPKDAELLASMHAEYIIDTYGFQIYTLSSMQRKHAEAAKKAGRWAPQPSEGLRDPNSVILPPKLRRVVCKDETEDGKWSIVDPRPLSFLSDNYALLSPALVDPSALTRLRAYFVAAGGASTVELSTSVEEIPPIRKGDPKQYEAKIALTPLGRELNMPAAEIKSRLFAMGKGTDRNIAIVLAAMHAEMIIDICGGQLYLGDPKSQKLHVMAARKYGRVAYTQDEVATKRPPVAEILFPSPLKLLVLGQNVQRTSLKSFEEDFLSKHVALAETTTAFRNIESSKIVRAELDTLQHFFNSKSDIFPRYQAPYMIERIGTQFRATVVLPIDDSFGIRGGVGLGQSAQEAENLAAMHALDVMCTLGIPVFPDPMNQTHWISQRKSQGRIVDVVSDKRAPSPSAYRRVMSEALPRPNQLPLTTEEAEVTPFHPDLMDPIPRREVVNRSCWSLDSDTKDGFIEVSEIESNRNELTSINNSFPHTIYSVRMLDPMAKNRIINYLAFLGKRITGTFSFHTATGDDGYRIQRCVIKLPVPPELGDRLAIGEAHEIKDAEICACMHAELILDNLGVPLYHDPSHQLKHATAVTSMGRYAPFPGDPIQDASTPTPPPLRKKKSDRTKGQVTSSPSNKSPHGSPASITKTPPAAVAKKPDPVPKPPVDNKPEIILEHDVDGNSKSRVFNYLRRVVKIVPEPQTLVETRNSTNIHSSRMWVPVPNRFGPRYAQGFAERKKDAENLCYMHAERIIDALGIQLFNLPLLQSRHVKRVSALGRWAITPGEKVDIPSDVATPPPLKIGGEMAIKMAFPTPTEFALEDFTSWNVFVQQCEEYIDTTKKQYETECYEKELIPKTGDPFMDLTLQDVESLRTTDNHAKSTLQNYCFQTNTPYPKVWKSQAVGPTQSRKALATIQVPGYEHITAYGVAATKENSQRRAAMHVLAILRRLDPDFSIIESTIDSQGGTNFISVVDAGKPGQGQLQGTAGRGGLNTGSWDKDSNAFTNDGKVRIVELYTVCYGLPAPSISQKRKIDGGAVFQQTVVEVTDEDGTVWQGRADDSGSRRNEVGAYCDLFIKMSRGIPTFQSLMQLVRTHPHLTPDQIVDMSIPPEIAERMEKLVEGMCEDTIAEAAAPEVSVDVTTEKLVEQTENTADQKEVQLRSQALIKSKKEKEENPEYKEKYDPRRKSLSIWDSKDELMETIKNNIVTVICGTTGCGKTTQVPQYILDYETDQGRGGDCTIIVTQPRRISAVSISQRIAAERLEKLGESVGYSIRLDSIPGRHINLVTSGVLLRIFNAKPNLDGIKYVLIDEIHERDINSDFLLILMRELILRRKDIRIILMSATLQSELFSRFFNGAPVINVEGYLFPVKELFLEDIAGIAFSKNEGALIPSFRECQTAENFTLHGPGGKKQKFKPNIANRPRYGFMEAHSEIDYAAVEYSIRHIIKMEDVSDSSILVFLPGWDEIIRTKELLERNSQYHILLMHSSVNGEDQLKCFNPAPEGKIKIILSTNIAESGVTIDDIKGVVDVGRAKEKSFIMKKGRTNIGKNEMGTMSQLVTVYASRANCVQRRGRAGRTRPGMCIRLYTNEHFETVAEFQTPEMLRQPLDSLCLQILALGLGDPGVFLNKALEPPSVETVEAAMTRLGEMGAVTPTRRLTPLGLKLSKLPVAPRVGKIIMMGAILRCLDAALTIAAACELEVFNASRDVRESSRVNKEHFSFNTQSDHIASYNAYNTFTRKCAEGGDIKSVMETVLENGFFIPSMRIVSRYKKQFFDILSQSGFLGDLKTPKLQLFVDESIYSEFSQEVAVVKTIIAAGLFPNVAMYRSRRLLRNKFENVISPSSGSITHRTAPEDVKNPFFIFEEMARVSDAQSRVNIRGVSNVNLWAILLMGASNSSLAFRDDLNLGLIDDWIVFRANFTDLDLIKRFKALLAKTIVAKLANPEDFDNNATMESLCSVVRDLVSSSMKPNNLTEGVWEEVGVITEGKPCAIDPTIVVLPPTSLGETEAVVEEKCEENKWTDELNDSIEQQTVICDVETPPSDVPAVEISQSLQGEI